MSVYQIGRLGKVYAAKETVAYGTAATFASSDAIRHINAQLNFSNNRVESQERFSDPSLRDKWTRRQTSNFLLGGLLYPSGTLNTLPDMAELFECGLGSVANTTLSTTVSSGASATGATLASGAGLAVGQGILINVTTGSPATGRVVRILTSVAGAVVTWDPALPQAPSVGDTVKGVITYSVATALPNALTIGHYLTSISKQCNGAVVDQLKLMFDANDEVRWEASGPAKTRLTAAQSAPGAFTTVGTTPPSGLVGSLRLGAVAVEFLKAEIIVQNAMELDNFQFGTSSATNFFRKNKRKIACNVTAILSDSTTLMAAAENATDNNALLIQCGQTEGNIVAVYGPDLDFDVPDMPDGEETLEITFGGTMKAVSGNDEFRLVLA
jgi:hypothetical protein